MFDPLAKIKIQIKAILSDSIIRVAEQNNVSVSAVPDFSVTESEDPSRGDFSSNAAFVLSDIFRLEPRKLSTQLTDTIDLNNSPFKDVACCYPGFINFRLNDDYLVDCIQSNVVFDYSDLRSESAQRLSVLRVTHAKSSGDRLRFSDRVPAGRVDRREPFGQKRHTAAVQK